MKFKTFLLALFLLAGTATAFANTNDKAKEAKKEKAKTVKVVEPKKAKKDLWFGSCTVKVISKTVNYEVTATCICTDKEACGAALALAVKALQ